MVVTHDARLIEATECRLWIVDEQEVTPWQGEKHQNTPPYICNMSERPKGYYVLKRDM